MKKWCKYTSEGGKKLWGYDIHYNAGDEYYMLEAEVAKYVRNTTVELPGEECEEEDTEEDSSDSESDSSSTSCQSDFIFDTDVENDLYLGEGVKPEFLL